jgi:hypothetical protein
MTASAWGGAGGQAVPAELGEHDLIGHGWVQVGSELVVAIRSRGVVGHLERHEKRTYSLSQVTAWRATGSVIEVTFRASEPHGLTGDLRPRHLGWFRCADAEGAADLTAQARVAGMSISESPRHSGI